MAGFIPAIHVLVGPTPLPGVIAGLDPAIHLFQKAMDARVKPAHDNHVASLSVNTSQL